MSEKWLQFYRTSLDLNRMATFDWDVVADTLKYDEMMTHLLQIDVPTSNVKENLLLAKMIHPKDRQEFQNHTTDYRFRRDKHCICLQRINYRGRPFGRI